jgi:hypothetical protein
VLSNAIAQALATDGAISLYAPCHDRTWQADFIEREQLMQYLQATSVSGPR